MMVRVERRQLFLVLCVAVALLWSLSFPLSASADGGTVISITVDDLKNPPEHRPSRCTKAPYTSYRTKALDSFRNSDWIVDGDNGDRFNFHYGDAKLVTNITKPNTPSVNGGDHQRWNANFESKTSVQSAEEAMEGFEPEDQEFESWCEAPVDTEEVAAGSVQPGSIINFWVPLITPDVLTGYLLLQLDRYLYGPDYRWDITLDEDGVVDPDGDVIVVKVPWVLTVGDTGPVTIRATATNLATPGGVSASITSRPVDFVFDGGDPEVDPVRCSFEQVDAGLCEYKYYHSSISLSKNGDPYVFDTTGYIVWDVSRSANGVSLGDLSPITYSHSSTRVAEVQAVTVSP